MLGRPDLAVSAPDIRYYDRVLVTLRPAGVSSPLVGVVIRTFLLREGTRCYTVVLDCPSASGCCMVDAPGDRLVVLEAS